jgi:hypothetical protein
MFGKLSKKLFLFLVITASVFAACDMTYIKDDSGGENDGSRTMTPEERDDYERTGRFLKLTYMPLNTQVANVSSTQVANSASVIAKLNSDDSIRIFMETDSCTVYLPLVYNDDSEFTENGSFYVAFTIHVDAVTMYVATRADKILVTFLEGRGTLDMRTLPVSGSDSAVILTGAERDELERNGRFLKLTHMPLNTQSANVVNVQIANSASSIAKLDENSRISIFLENDSSTVYLPLVYNDGTEFVENGAFYTAFTVHVDAVTKYILILSDNFLIPFTNGRGTLDVRTLPYKGSDSADRRYLTIYNLPPNLAARNVSRVFVHNRNGPVAECADYSLVEVFTGGGKSSISIPLNFSGSDLPFSGTGSFFVSFDLYIDALTHFTVKPNDSVLVSFNGGSGYLNIDDLPDAAAANYSRLTITNLPQNLAAHNISRVFVHNRYGPAAECADYSLVEVYMDNGRAEISIPLKFSGSGLSFSGTGSFFVSFDLYIDALLFYSVSSADAVLVSFVDGNGRLNIDDLPVPPAVNYSYLTIKNLPPNLSANNASNVTVHDQSGEVAFCKEYSRVEISIVNGKSVMRVPLFYRNSQIFSETGTYLVSFDINIDAVTRYIITPDDRVQVAFTNGNGELDILNIPENIVPYLTIIGLPQNTTKKQISNVAVYNMTGAVAGCKNYNNIIILQDKSTTTALIPMSYSSGSDYFQDSGMFIVTFTVNVDALTQISYGRDSELLLQFTKGQATLDLINGIGLFKAQLVNPADTAAPIIKGGSSFDLDGRIHFVSSADVAIDALLPSTSCVLYLYAYRLGNDVVYEYSEKTPDYVSGKKGYYSGGKRALWKMLFLLDGGHKFLFKTYVADNWPQFGSYLPSTAAFGSSFPTGFLLSSGVYSLSGNANPEPANITLSSGIYIVMLQGGAGGGGGRAYSSLAGQDSTAAGSNYSSGGSGGSITEIISLGSQTGFTAFTGSGGRSPSDAATVSSGTSPTFDFRNGPYGQGQAWAGRSGAFYGGAGGGGGSGTFLFSDAGAGYFLCAGGGGGGSGGSLLSPGGGGGAGGSIGSGAGGGANGFLKQTYTSSSYPYAYEFSLIGTGGRGGGFNGGIGGTSSTAEAQRNGANGSIVLSAVSGFSFSGQEASSYNSASITPVRPGISHETSTSSGKGGAAAYIQNIQWQNTNNANGQGGNAPSLRAISSMTTIVEPGSSSPIQASSLNFFPSVTGSNGSPGGNNRNSTKGNGPAGNTGDGAAGSITIFKIF